MFWLKFRFETWKGKVWEFCLLLWNIYKCFNNTLTVKYLSLWCGYCVCERKLSYTHLCMIWCKNISHVLKIWWMKDFHMSLNLRFICTNGRWKVIVTHDLRAILQIKTELILKKFFHEFELSQDLKRTMWELMISTEWILIWYGRLCFWK